MKQVILIVLSLLSFQFVNAQISQAALSKYSSDEVREYVKEYDDYILKIITAMEQKDEDLLLSLAAHSDAMSDRFSEMNSKFTAEDATLFAKLANEWNERFSATHFSGDIDDIPTKTIPEKGAYIRN